MTKAKKQRDRINAKKINAQKINAKKIPAKKRSKEDFPSPMQNPKTLYF
jgi:hypothetical protein